MSAGFGLAGCAAIDDLKSAISQWFETPKVPDGREVFPREVPEAIAIISPQKKQEPVKASKKMAKSARKPQRPQTAKLQKQPPTSETTPAVSPEETEGKSAPPATLRLRTPYPEAPPPGAFSR